MRRSPRHVSLLAAWMAISCERTTPPNPAGASSAQADPTASAAEPSGDVRRHLFFAAPSRRAPLVMFLHGYGSSPDGAAKAFELARIARELDVHVVVPEGTPDKVGNRFWNAGGACCDFERTGIDDVATLRRVIAHASAQHEVSRRLVVGFSNGAFMAHRLGCQASDVVDGFAAFAGVGPADPGACRPERKIDVLQIHGTKDRAVSYDGGHVLGREDMESHPGAVATTLAWAALNECGDPSPVSPPHAIADKPTAAEERACATGTRVALWTISEGGHLSVIDRRTIEAAIRYLLKPQRDMK